MALWTASPWFPAPPGVAQPSSPLYDGQSVTIGSRISAVRGTCSLEILGDPSCRGSMLRTRLAPDTSPWRRHPLDPLAGYHPIGQVPWVPLECPRIVRSTWPRDHRERVGVEIKVPEAGPFPSRV